MKLAVCLVTLCLVGCSTAQEPVMETIGPEAYQDFGAKPVAAQIHVLVPEQAVSEAIADGQNGMVYTWEDHTLILQTRDSGNIQATVEALTGQDYDNLTVMSRNKGDLTYYQTVWSATGEGQINLGRALIADDGAYHYCLSLVSPEDSDAQQVYDSLCASFSLTSGDAGK